jgi:hypothetical protein
LRLFRIIPVTFMHPPARHSSRLGQRLQGAIGAAAALAAISLSPGSAQALVVTVGGTQYDVTTFTGSYNDNSSKFAQPPAPGVMPWWGSSSNATAFASAVGTNLGTPNNPYGPFFAHSYDPNYDPGFGPDPAVFAAFVQGNTTIDTVISPSNPLFVYAQATLYTDPTPAAAPGPLPLFGAAAAFGFSRKLRKRIKLAPGALASSQPMA